MLYNIAYFQTILQCIKKPVYLEYGQRTFMGWSKVLPCCGANGMNVQDEVEGLRVYLQQHKNIAGLIIHGLDINVSINMVCTI